MKLGYRQKWCCFICFVVKCLSSVRTDSTPVVVLLQTFFEEFSIDGSNINDGFAGGGTQDEASVRRQNITVKSDEVASFFVPAQHPATFDRAASDLVAEQTHLSILCWNPSPIRGSPGTIQNHVAGRWHMVALQESAEFLEHEDTTLPVACGSLPRLRYSFNKHTFEPHLEVNSVYVRAVKAYCSG